MPGAAIHSDWKAHGLEESRVLGERRSCLRSSATPGNERSTAGRLGCLLFYESRLISRQWLSWRSSLHEFAQLPFQ